MNAIEQSDNELIYMIRCGSKEAFDLLSYKYEKIIGKYVYENFKDSYIYGYDIDDVIQECFITFYDVLYCFNEDKGAFYSYVIQSIRYRIYDLIKSSLSSKKSGFNYLTLDLLNDESLSNIKNIELYGNECEETHPINNFILKETACSIFGDESLLLDLEKQVLSLKIMGYSIAEISRKLKINRKKVEYIIKISRKKVKQIL